MTQVSGIGAIFQCNRPFAGFLLDSKITLFWHCFIWVISLTGDKMVPVPWKSNGKDK